MKHQITVLLGCAMFLGACNKENVVETPTTLVAMNYKIQPACMFTRCGEYLAENFTRPCKRYCMGWYHAKSQPLL